MDPALKAAAVQSMHNLFDELKKGPNRAPSYASVARTGLTEAKTGRSADAPDVKTLVQLWSTQ